MLQLLEKTSATNYVAPELSSKAALGQYMTPAKIAAFMASFFPNIGGNIHLLDAGAGEGSLTCAFLGAWQRGVLDFSHGEVSLFELDSALASVLDKKTSVFVNALPLKRNIYQKDFIQYAGKLISEKQRIFTHAVLNPPYKKINSKSKERLILRDVGIETVNLYAAFVALSIALLQPKGHLVAIIPRSFCNGPYYKPFREFIMEHAAIRRIHLYDSRTEAFKNDGVLQENVIIHLERDAKQENVTISTSRNADMDEYNSASYQFEEIVIPNDSEKFIHIPD